MDEETRRWKLVEIGIGFHNSTGGSGCSSPGSDISSIVTPAAEGAGEAAIAVTTTRGAAFGISWLYED